jgi:hypothetical protein
MVFSPLIGVLFKWLIIGKYRAGRYPMWGSYYLRYWIVEQIIEIMGIGIYSSKMPVIGNDNDNTNDNTNNNTNNNTNTNTN